ncbi:MAG: Rrf2 family transcriptional regulator [Spirochaetota bacterium]
MLLSRSCEYALQAVIFLSSQPTKSPLLQKHISDALKIPSSFLGKILQNLSHHNIVASKKGKSGGFFISASPENLTLYDVVVIMDGSTFLDKCILGFPGCHDKCPCPVHHKWIKIKTVILQMLKEKTVGELSKKINVKLACLI